MRAILIIQSPFSRRVDVRDGPLPKRIGLPHSILRKRAAEMYHTTGFAKDDIAELCVLVHEATMDSPGNVWPPVLGLFKSVAVTLTYLRRNRVQAELGEAFG